MEPQDYLQEYVEEVREHLQDLEQSLLALEREGRTPDNISPLFRAAHSIKGASAYMGFEQIAHLTHEIESLFSDVQSHGLDVTAKGISTLLSCVDYISTAVGQLRDAGAEPPVPHDLLAALQEIRAADSGEEGEWPEVFAVDDGSLDDCEVDFSSVQFPDMSAAAPDPLDHELPPDVGRDGNASAGDAPAEPDEDDAELLSIFIASFREGMDRIYSVLASAPGAPLTQEETHQVVAMLQRLQASCQYMDYEEIASLARAGEESIRQGVGESRSREEQSHALWAVLVNPIQERMPWLELPSCPLKTMGPVPPDEEALREDDEELLAIYLETFRQYFSELASLGSAHPRGNIGRQHIETARGLIRKLIAASRYMDYDPVTVILAEWDEKLVEAHGAGIEGAVCHGELLGDFARRLERALPALKPLPVACARSDSHSLQHDLDEEIDRSFDALERTSRHGEDEGRSAAPLAPLAGPGGSHGGMDLTGDEEAAAGAALLPDGSPERTPSVAEEMPSTATLRVDARKVDQLLNQVGELVVTRSEFVQTVNTLREMLRDLATQGKLAKQDLRRLKLIGFRLHESTLSLGRVANDLQDSSMRIRMLPIAQLFQRFPRVARDQSLKMGKKLELLIEGGETEIDKRVLEQMHDPLVQFLRNAIAHGIESPEERREAGKPEVGSIRLAAYHEGDFVALEIEDDGRGIDTDRLRKALQGRGEMTLAEIERLSEDDLKYAIFLPGLSTRETVDGHAGRGVGLDVVKENVERMNGTIEVFSTRGTGTRFQIRIPLTVAIIRALLVTAADQVFTLPLTSVAEILRYKREETHAIEGFEVISLRGRTIPIVHLSQLLNLPESPGDRKSRFIIIVSTSFREVGLVVGGLMGEREVVIKPIEDDFHVFRGFSGATVLGDGTVSLIVDVSALLRMMRDTLGSHPGAPLEPERRLPH
ncbi:MAG: chemotaxis protein CheA [Syntrophobacteraceae bacterium]|jgi:two-component system chemotaxis sensor kinase CheA|nr:chemotaxis protein CheA [Syntrophobacteraceae bacterium]